MKLEDKLLGALIGLARSCGNHAATEQTTEVLIQGLVEAERKEEAGMQHAYEMVQDEKRNVAPNCSTCQSRCGNTDDYDLNNLKQETEQIQKWKEQILTSLMELARRWKTVDGEKFQQADIFYKGLCYVSFQLEEDFLVPLYEEIRSYLQ